MKNLFTFLFAVVFLVSCSMEEPASETPDPLDNQFLQIHAL